MNKSKKPVVLSTAILAVVVIFALAGNAVRSASAKFTLPLFVSKPAASEDVLKIGTIDVKGIVDLVATDSISVNGLSFKIDTTTQIEGAPAVGDSVEVKAFLLADKTYFALKVEKLDELFAAPKFEFSGVVETMAADMLTVSGVEIGLAPTAKVDTGIEVGAFVEVSGTIEAGKLVASAVSLEVKAGMAVKVEWIGVIDSISGTTYVVSGKTVNTDAATVISGTLAVGNVVKVEALLNTDGSFMATAINLVQSQTDKNTEDHQGEDSDDQGEDQSEDESGKEVEMAGTVDSFSDTSIVVGGVTFAINDKTEIEGTLAVGAMVKIEGVTQTDGTTIAHEIEVKDNSSMTPGDDSSKSDDEHSGSSTTPSGASGEHEDDKSGSHDGDHHDGDHEDDHEDGGGSGSDSFGFSS